MEDLCVLFSEELKRFCSKWNIFLWVILAILLLVFGDQNITKFESLSPKEAKFMEIQNKYFLTIPNYTKYSMKGIYTMFIPSPASVLYGNGIVPTDLISKVDSVVGINIYNNAKGKTLAPGNLNYKTDFSSTVMLILTLLGLFYGFEAMQQREYFKIRTSMKSRGKIFFAVIGSKFLLFILAFLALHAVLVAQMLLYGIHLSAFDYASLLKSLPSTFFLLLIFFSSGVIIGALRLKGFHSAISIFTVWFVLIFMIPAAINFRIEHKMPDAIDDYQTELEKIDIVAQYEKKSNEENGPFNRNNIEKERKGIEEYWNVHFKEIEAREEKLRNRFADAIDEYNLLSIFSPVNNYLLTCSEISSRGHENFLDYYRFNQDLQKKFVRFYINRTFYNDPKIMVNFLDNEDPIYHAKSTLPKYFHWGLLVNALYCLILLLISYYRFCRYLYPKPKRADEFRLVDLHFEKGKSQVIDSPDDDFCDQFVNIFYGMDKHFTGKITIDGKNILDGQKKDFTYLPDIKDIPEDVPIKSIVKLFDAPIAEFNAIIAKKFGDLKPTEQANLLLTCALHRKSSIYLLNNFLFAPVEYLETYKQKLDAIKETGVLIYMTRSVNINFQPDWTKIIIFDPEDRSYKKMREPGEKNQ